MRRRGMGTRLISQVHPVICEHAQTTLTIMAYEADGHAFLQPIGAQQKTSNIECRPRCDRLDEARLTAWENTAMASHQGLALEAYRGRVPFEAVEPPMTALTNSSLRSGQRLTLTMRSYQTTQTNKCLTKQHELVP